MYESGATVVVKMCGVGVLATQTMTAHPVLEKGKTRKNGRQPPQITVALFSKDWGAPGYGNTVFFVRDVDCVKSSADRGTGIWVSIWE